MHDWDDSRYFLGVAAHGSTLAAAAALNSSQSTVFRRIASIEGRIAVQLFDRQPAGYVLTTAGQALLPLARAVQTAVENFDHFAQSEVRQAKAIVRLSVPDAALEYVLPPVMAEFRRVYPEVRLEIIASPRQLDLSSGEADVALRVNPAPDPDVYGRRLVDERPVLVSSRTYAESHALPRSDAEVAAHRFIGVSGVLANVLAGWLERAVPAHRVLLQPDSVGSALTAIRNGMGLGVLPQFIVDREPTLTAATLVLPIEPSELWIVTHRRLKGSAVVRSLMDMVAAYVHSTTPSRAGTQV